MAGMEGGAGGGPLNWGSFWLGMLMFVLMMISAISIGIHFGWLH